MALDLTYLRGSAFNRDHRLALNCQMQTKHIMSNTCTAVYVFSQEQAELVKQDFEIETISRYCVQQSNFKFGRIGTGGSLTASLRHGMHSLTQCQGTNPQDQ